MVKQITLICLAVSLCVMVWVVVILKLNSSYSRVDYSVKTSSNSELVKKVDNERHFPFPQTIIDNEKVDELIENAQPLSVDTSTSEQGSITYQINLGDYDFSDIATQEGVPIDGILNKLGIMQQIQ